MRRALRLLALLFIGLAAPGQAETFVGLRGGLYTLTGGGDLEELFQGLVEPGEFDAGTIGVHAVYYFTPNIAGELSVDAFVPDVDFLIPTADPNLPIPANASFGVFPIGVGARYRLWPEGISPVGFAGLDVQPYTFDVEFVGLPEFGVSDSGVKLGYHFGIGAEVPFGLRWLATGELQYRSMAFSTSFLANDGTAVEFEPSFSGIQLLFGLGYAF